MNSENFNFLTSDSEIKKHKIYAEISHFLSDLVHNGTIDIGAGYCISMADMVKFGLKAKNISCRVVECQLAITYIEDQTWTRFVGFDNIKMPGQVDTHMIVITETDPPFLVDASIKHLLPMDTPAIIEPIAKPYLATEIILEKYFVDKSIKVVYQEKKNQRVPQAYQRSILERIETDQKIFKNINFLKILIIVALIISTINALRGAYDFHSVYFSENNWGPKTLESIETRLIDLEKKIDKE